MKYLWIAILFLMSSAFSQEGGDTLTVGYKSPYGFDGGYLKEKRIKQLNIQDVKQYKFNYEGLKLSKIHEIKTPINLAEKDKEKVLNLFRKIQILCPNCSTGTTIGGRPIVGLNIPRTSDATLFSTSGLNVPRTSDATLFSTSGLCTEVGEYINIKKSEYESLKSKADLYDALKK